MASTNGKNKKNSRNSSTRTKTTASKKNKASTKPAPMDVEIRSELLLILLCAFCVFLFLCNLGIVGRVGAVVSSVQFGIFGLVAYIFPIILFLGIAFGISNYGNKIAARKLIAGIVACLLFMMICEMFVSPLSKDSQLTAKAIYEQCAANKNGGGIIGGGLALCLSRLIGFGGLVLVIFVLAVISFVVITEKSVIKEVTKQSKKVYSRSMEDIAYHRERMAYRREQMLEEKSIAEAKKREQSETLQEQRKRKSEERENEKILRMNKKVSGVSIDTSLKRTDEQTDIKESNQIKGNIHEITVEDFMKDKIPAVKSEPTRVPIENTEKEHLVIHTLPEAEEKVDEVIKRPAIHLPEADFAQKPAYTPVVKKDGMTFETDNAFCGEGAPNKPEASFVKKQANHMQPDESIPKVLAAPPKQVEKTEPKMQMKPPMFNRPYQKPPISLLKAGNTRGKGDSAKELRDTAEHLQKTLATFGVNVTITEISQGPAVTRYEMQPEQGVKVSKIVGLQDDIKLNLAATDIRIEAPIPGKAAVGIEVPNKENSAVALRDLLEAKEYQSSTAGLCFAVGKDIGGQTVVTDIAKMPHMLIAGATGSGKSVCINTIIMSILYKYDPDDVKLIMIDPKVVELSVYNGIPHLLVPVVTDPKKASAALHWAVAEMTDRYNKFADFNVRDLKGYNKKAKEMRERGDANAPEKDLPLILIIVDELADLMMVAPGEVEESICRLAQLARAAGIHLIIATQRPSVDVITGLIKANMPSRIAFSVSSGVDSRTILDMTGAEKLLGKGDMLFYPQGYSKPARIQGAFVSDSEVSDVVDYIKAQMYISSYANDVEEQMKTMQSSSGNSNISADGNESQYDPLFADAGRFIIEKDKASIGMLQRVFKIGFNRAARIMDQLCEIGLVGEEEGTKPRKILMSPEQFEQILEEII